MLEWVRAGKELRQLADAFSRSKERDAVRQKASKIPVETLDIDHFMQLLQELFQVADINKQQLKLKYKFLNSNNWCNSLKGGSNYKRTNCCAVLFLCRRRHASLATRLA